MSSVEAFSTIARRAVEREQARHALSFDVALRRYARRLRAGPGTLANVIRERVKSVSFDLGNRILSDAMSDLSNQIQELEREREHLMEMGASPDDRTLGRVVRAIEAVRKTLSGLGEAA